MLINWFIVAAQIINFLILVILLKRLLFQPILQVMKRREARISEEWRKARALQQEAGRVKSDYDGLLQNLEGEEAALRARARTAAEQEGQRVSEALQNEIEERRKQWQLQLHQDQEGFLRSLSRRVEAQVEAIARRALQDLASVELEHQLVSVFLGRLDGLDAGRRAAIQQALAPGDQPIEVRTRHPLPEELRTRLIAALHRLVPTGPAVTFRAHPALSCGIEVTFAGQEVAWSLDSYLDTLEQELSRALG